MNKALKPIISIKKLTMSEELLVSLGATFNLPRSEAIYNGVKYYYTSFGQYICLNPNELCISEEIEVKTPVHAVKYTVPEDYLIPGLILVASEDKLIPILNHLESSMKSIILEKDELLNIETVDKILSYFGFDDLINSFLIDDLLISSYVEGDKLKLTTGINSEVSKLDIAGLDWISEDYRTALEDTANSLEESYLKVFKWESLIKNGFDEVVNYGDISDYISIKTLLDHEVVDLVQIPNDPNKRKEYRVIQNKSEVKIGPKWNPEPDNELDPFVYWYPKKSYDIVKPRILEGDLLELSILYRKCIIDDKSKTANSLVDNPDIIIQGGFDSEEFYSEEGKQIQKIEFKKGSEQLPITFNGYQVIYDDMGERSETIKVFVKDSILVTDDFYIQVDSKSINLFPKSPEVTEYYIKSCKKLIM